MRLYPFALLFTACAYGNSQLSGSPLGIAAEPTAAEAAAAASSAGPEAGPTPSPCPESREPCVVRPEVPPGAPQQEDDAEEAGPPDAEATAETRATRERVVEAARKLLGKRFRGDCSSFVRKVYSEAGLEVQPAPAPTMSEGLFLNMPTVERPMPGDLAFFHDTYGRVRPGQDRPRTTHVAVVERVQGAIVWLIHRGKHGIARIQLNLESRHDRETNDYIRIRHRRDRPGLLYLAGELLSGFGALPGLAPDDP